MSEIDYKLGQRIHEALQELNIETPMVAHPPHQAMQYEHVHQAFTDIMNSLGMDLTDDSLQNTPDRVARMYCQEIFYGLNYANFPSCTTVENKMKYDEMIVSKCTVMSCCEHHFVPFIGEAFIAYIPRDKVLGLSKFNRVVDFFCRRPQIQERLTAQIHAALVTILESWDVAVVVKARHYCVHLRGVKDANSETITSKVTGKFRTVPEAREEFLLLTRNGGK